MRIIICTTLYCATESFVNVPVESWKDIKEWYVKWDTLHYTIDGQKWLETPLNSDTTDVIDWKRPISVTVHDVKNYDRIDEH